tara:strand:- start:870 stop:1328 length:459 start_codon:yes stop_codon:yes gene_type:complete
MTSSYFDSTYSEAPGGWTLPKEAYPTWKPDPGKEFDWTAQEKSPSLFDNFISNLGDELGANTRRFAGAGAKREGDTYIKPPGATVADLGGGNTLYVPDTTTQMRMAQAPTPSGPGLGGQLAGAGAAAATSLIPGVGPFLAPVANNFVSGLFG